MLSKHTSVDSLEFKPSSGCQMKDLVDFGYSPCMKLNMSEAKYGLLPENLQKLFKRVEDYEHDIIYIIIS